MAEEALESSTPKANFNRLTRLLIRGGENFLRETLDSFYSPANLHLKLTHSGTKKKLNLSPPERACLYPSPGETGESKDFDITLTFKLLKNICGLTEPPGGWNELPSDSEETLEADLARINYYRNEVYAHHRTMEISDEKFVDLWERIKEALLRIAKEVCPEKRDEWKKSIDHLLRKPLTPDEERCIEELKTWHVRDMDLKYKVERLEDKVMYLITLVLDTRKNGHGHNQAAGSEPEPEQATEADDPDIWTVILSFRESVDLLFKYLWCRLHLPVRNHKVGSWHITVECSSLQVLEGLWEDYRSGHLNSVAQEMLITPQVLEKLGLTELKLRTFISEDQYERGKKLLEAISDPLTRISILERENVALKAKVKAKEETSGTDRDLSAMILTLERENLELKEGMKASEGTFESKRDLLARISTLERENIELKEGMKAIEGTFESERDILTRISKLERENVELKEKVNAMEETFGSERGLLARIPKLENVELKERMKGIEETFESERDLSAMILTLECENLELKERMKAMEETFESLLARIPKLENVELKERMKGIEETFESERDVLARIPKLEPKNVELKERMKFSKGFFITGRGPLARIFKLERENVELKEKVKAMEETFIRERGLLARISKFENRELKERMKGIEGTFESERDLLAWIPKLEREKVELKERMKGIEGTFESERGMYSGFCQVIINRTTQEELVGEKDEIVHVFKMLNYRVDKATCTPSDDLKKLVQSIVARDYEHCDIFVCFILSNLTENMEMESVKGGAFNVRDLMDMFSPPNCPKLAGKPKVFIFLVHQKAAASESKYSIAEKLITEVPFYGLCLLVPYGKGYLSALLNEIMSSSLHLDLLTILKEAKKSFYAKTEITIPDPVHNFRGKVFLAV